MNRLLCALLSVLLMAPFRSAEEPVRERIEWIDIWVTDADKDDLPRVLLVGDSITRGYFGDVEKHLSAKAQLELGGISPHSVGFIRPETATPIGE